MARESQENPCLQHDDDDDDDIWYPGIDLVLHISSKVSPNYIFCFFGRVSLFNGISTFASYLMLELSL